MELLPSSTLIGDFQLSGVTTKAALFVDLGGEAAGSVSC